MSLEKVIISIAICVGILYFQATKPKFLRFILTGFIFSCISSFFNGEVFSIFSLLSFGVLVLMYFVYSIYLKNILPALISIFPLMGFIFKVQHWPYASLIEIAMLIPILLFTVTLFNFKTYKNQFSILTILVSYAISQFIKYLEHVDAFIF